MFDTQNEMTTCRVNLSKWDYLGVDFTVKVSFLHFELSGGVSDRGVSLVLGVHSGFFTFSFLQK